MQHLSMDGGVPLKSQTLTNELGREDTRFLSGVVPEDRPTLNRWFYTCAYIWMGATNSTQWVVKYF